MTYDEVKTEDAVLALLAAFSFDGGRIWKSFDFDVMDHLHAQDFIENPRAKASRFGSRRKALSVVAKLPSGFFRLAQAMPANTLLKSDGSAAA